MVANSHAQVIYMLSETQARDAVIKETNKYVGKVYAMVGDRTGDSNSKKNSEIKDVELSWGKRKKIKAINYNKKIESASFVEL